MSRPKIVMRPNPDDSFTWLMLENVGEIEIERWIGDGEAAQLRLIFRAEGAESYRDEVGFGIAAANTVRLKITSRDMGDGKSSFTKDLTAEVDWTRLPDDPEHS